MGNKKNLLRKIRFDKGITQDDLFLETRIWPCKISKIERSIYPASQKEKKLIAKALRVSIKEIFPEG